MSRYKNRRINAFFYMIKLKQLEVNILSFFCSGNNWK